MCWVRGFFVCFWVFFFFYRHIYLDIVIFVFTSEKRDLRLPSVQVSMVPEWKISLPSFTKMQVRLVLVNSCKRKVTAAELSNQEVSMDSLSS